MDDFLKEVYERERINKEAEKLNKEFKAKSTLHKDESWYNSEKLIEFYLDEEKKAEEKETERIKNEVDKMNYELERK